jgi:hypothetical protein
MASCTKVDTYKRTAQPPADPPSVRGFILIAGFRKPGTLPTFALAVPGYSQLLF